MEPRVAEVAQVHPGGEVEHGAPVQAAVARVEPRVDEVAQVQPGGEVAHGAPAQVQPRVEDVQNAPAQVQPRVEQAVPDAHLEVVVPEYIIDIPVNKVEKSWREGVSSRETVIPYEIQKMWEATIPIANSQAIIPPTKREQSHGNKLFTVDLTNHQDVGKCARIARNRDGRSQHTPMSYAPNMYRALHDCRLSYVMFGNRQLITSYVTDRLTVSLKDEKFGANTYFNLVINHKYSDERPPFFLSFPARHIYALAESYEKVLGMT